LMEEAVVLGRNPQVARSCSDMKEGNWARIVVAPGPAEVDATLVGM
jgi:hypothetical protein